MKQIMTYKLMIGVLVAVLIASCKKEEMDFYSSGRYVQFASAVQDSISFSFFYHLGKEEVRFPLPVRLVGALGSQDETYHLEALLEDGTASSGNFSLPAQQVFRKGMSRDTAWVTLKRTPELDNKDVRLVLRIAGGSEMAAGQTDCIYKIIRLTALVSKPQWWDTNMDTYYLGRYSEKKFRTFMEVAGVGDLEGYDNNQRLILMLQFKYYLIEQKEKGTPLYMEDGADMLSTVPLIG